MLRLRSLLVLAAVAAVTAATLAPGAAAPVVRTFSPPVFQTWHGGGDHDFWGHRHRRDFIGPVAPVFGEAPQPGPATAPSPFVVSAPVFVSVTIAPAGGPAPIESTSGPQIIELGQSAPPRRPLPLIVYGD
jgi:hypothetical protein